jgi:phosphoenolpyruvate synthase/pyruvate phosphate dikinase
MPDFIIPIAELDKTTLPLAGGKGANLGELTKIAGVKVPPGFCVTTGAYQAIITANPEMDEFFGQMAGLDVENFKELRSLAQRIRRHIQGISIPEGLQREIYQAWEMMGRDGTYAIRSSATAEDLPYASFAGQQDTYLNIKGIGNIIQHIRRCWASLFTDRAIAYRAKNRFDHRKVLLAVVVQRMVFPEVAGIMFTADPVNGNRNVVSIDAGFGLGEALVSGKITTDLYKVQNGKIIKKQIAVKKIAIFSRPGGGTFEQGLPAELQTCQALSDEQILVLAELGKTIENHFQAVQDIEWCLAKDGEFYIVQSRPVTTLFPLPDLRDDQPHVWLSFGHLQMMIDPVKPLGMSIFKRIAPDFEVVASGGRLFMDFTNYLTSRIGRKMAISFGKTDLLMNSAIKEIVNRRDFIATLKPGKQRTYGQMKKMFLPLIIGTLENLASGVPGDSLGKMREHAEAKAHQVANQIKQLPGVEKLNLIAANVRETYQWLTEEMVGPIMAALLAFDLINRLAKRWLGDTREIDDLTKSPPENITSEMGLALGDLADVVREYPAVIAYLRRAEDNTFWSGLVRVDGGGVVTAAFTDFLEQYGMRCPGEIDLTRPRWRERPAQLVPAILSHIQSMEPGEHRRKFKEGEAAARKAERTILSRLEKTTGGIVKVKIMARLIKVYRGFIGFREYPKYFLITLFGIYKEALMEEAVKLVRAGTLKQAEDVYYLFMEELEAAIRTRQVDYRLIEERKEQYQEYERLTPPRVMTSEGEVLSGIYENQDAPADALLGIPVSAGIVEGRARVIVKPEEGTLMKGDILVAPFTDPGWTPFFASASGLVTEVGGQMTHGSVIAREYGIPAVVGVQEATKIIQDGQQIRVNGTKGYVELVE